MAKRKPLLPDYGTVQIKGKIYFRTRLSDDEGNRISLYAASREELYEKVMEVEKQIENKTFRRSTPTVREYHKPDLCVCRPQDSSIPCRP